MRLLICTQVADRRDPILGFFHTWIEELATRCEYVTVVCLFEGEHSFPENVKVISLGKEKTNIKNTPSALHKLLLRIGYIKRLWYISWRIRKEYDSVFVHMNPEYLVVTGVLWKLLHKRIALWYVHKATPVFLRLALPFADVIFTSSSESFRIVSSKVRIVGHGIDTKRPIPFKVHMQGTIRLIATGRVSPTKRIDVMLDAFLLLKKRGIAVTFSVIGAAIFQRDREYEKRLRIQLQNAGENPDAVFVGPVVHADMPKWRSRADYLLHASETGSLDKTVLDAAFSGVIPISSSKAYERLFEGYEALLMYTPGDSAMLAQKITQLESLEESQREEIRATLKERVVKEHSLANLMNNIVRGLTSV